MFSKGRYIYLMHLLFVLIFTVGLLSSCVFKTGEKPFQPAQPKVSFSNTTCMNEIGDVISQYFDLKLNDQQIEEFFGCLQNTFRLFKKHVRGSHPNYYEAEELRRFLQDYVLGDKKISAKLLFHSMRVKQIFVGGDVETFDKKELDVLIDLLGTVQKVTVMLNPHLGYLKVGIKGESTNPDYEKIKLASGALKVASSILLERFSGSQTSYKFSEFKQLIEELNRFAGREGEGLFSNEKIGPLVDFLRSFKRLHVSNGAEDVINPQDWKVLFSGAANWYGTVLKLSKIRLYDSLIQGAGFTLITDSIQEILDQTRYAVSQAGDRGYIPFELLFPLIDAAEELGIIPFKIKASTLRSVFPVIYSRFFGDPNLPGDERVKRSFTPGLDLVGIDRAQGEFDLWKHQQDDFIKTYLLHGDGVFQQYFESYQNGYKFNNSALNNIFHSRPMFKPGHMGIYLVTDYHRQMGALNNNFENVSKFNVSRMAIRLLMRGYAKGNRAKYLVGVELEEFEQFYNDARALGVDLKIMHPKNKGVAKRSFIEGNLFTFSANGYDFSAGSEPIVFFPDGSHTSRWVPLLSFQEGMELLTILFSGGYFGYKVFYELQNICGSLPSTDVYELHKIDKSCVFANFRQQIMARLTHLPLLMDLLKSYEFTPSMWAEFHSQLYDTAHNDQIETEGEMSSSEIVSAVTLIHYLEMIMVRYDFDGSGYLEANEVRSAWKVYKGIFNTVIDKDHPDMSPEDRLKVFFYMLDKGENPGVAGFSTYGLDSDGAKIKVNRQKLMKVFTIFIKNISGNS